MMDRFQTLRMKINEWERSIKNGSVSLVEIYQQFNSLSKVITELSNQIILTTGWCPDYWRTDGNKLRERLCSATAYHGVNSYLFPIEETRMETI